MTCDCAPRLDALEKRLTTLEDEHDDRLDEHDREIRALKKLVSDLRSDMSAVKTDVAGVRVNSERLANAMTSQGLLLEKVHSLLEQFVRQQTPAVEVSGV